MARIHIIWDPEDKLTTSGDVMDASGIKVAILPVYGSLAYGEIAQIAQKLSEVFLEQMCHGK